MDNLDLKPCPFCGGKAFLYADDGICARCGDCNARTRTFRDYWIANKTTGIAALSAIEAWNNRVQN